MTIKKRFIARCTPSLGKVSIWWAQMAENILWPMNVGKITLFMKDSEGGEIAECRNKLVSQVLSFESEEREITHILWLDDDVLPTRGVLLQLLSHNRDIASGAYFTKLPGFLCEPLIFPSEGSGTDRFIPDKAYKVWGHGMGLALVRMDVYRRMREDLKLPLDKYGNPEWYRTNGRPEDLRVEDKVIHIGGTEDLYFLDKASHLGYSGFIDTGKHAFGFHYNEDKDQGYPEKQWKQFQKEHCIIWDTPDGEVKWE